MTAVLRYDGGRFPGGAGPATPARPFRVHALGVAGVALIPKEHSCIESITAIAIKKVLP